MLVVEGHIHNASGHPLVEIPVEAFQSNLFIDSNLTPFPEVTDSNGPSIW